MTHRTSGHSSREGAFLAFARVESDSRTRTHSTRARELLLKFFTRTKASTRERSSTRARVLEAVLLHDNIYFTRTSSTPERVESRATLGSSAGGDSGEQRWR
jgi:hypothetical protein